MVHRHNTRHPNKVMDNNQKHQMQHNSPHECQQSPFSSLHPLLANEKSNKREQTYVLLQGIIQHSPPKQCNGKQSKTPDADEHSFGDL